MKEIKLNEIFDHKGVMLKVEEEIIAGKCVGCYFRVNKGCNLYKCGKDSRTDKQNVIFNKV